MSHLEDVGQLRAGFVQARAADLSRLSLLCRMAEIATDLLNRAPVRLDRGRPVS
jgi:hypothetical protein